ncbi:hypothetical protein CN285_24975 [Bacillus cereus]|uniref:hypothetical protein n=1 Tax=Bacillus paramycoides TaxID=2026194 RepID=UPI000BF64271|nr:hypothetical protein [Bacillus paramycoides]PFD34733.1 hypothetical protein CN285_24975 [Bacillus cereus]PGM56691.1 hypothetical protein CN947_24155 [Bacillus cereus]
MNKLKITSCVAFITITSRGNYRTRKWIIITLFSIAAFILLLVYLGAFDEELKSTDYREIAQFMEVSKGRKEIEIDVVTQYFSKGSLASDASEQPRGWIIYHLKARYDKEMNQS